MMKLAEAALPKVRARDYRSAPEHKVHGEKQALRWLEEGLALLAIDEAALRRMKGSDGRKVALAKLLWEQTTVSQGWIAQRLHMSSAANVSQLLNRTPPASRRRTPLPARFSKWLQSVRR
jgi:hypothetical protein